MADVSGKSITSNLFWRFLERCGAQGVSFVVSIILARLLDPSAYGVIALITVFTSVLEVFVGCGFSTALVQKKNPDDLDFSSVFYFNIVSCLILYIGLFFAAPFIASFYGNQYENLTMLIRAQGLVLVISGVKGVLHSIISKQMAFKKFFFATLGGTIGAAIIGIFMAFKGYGIWALIVQNLFNHVVDTIILWLTVKWHPKWMFSFQRLKSLFSFGWKILASSLLDTVYKKLRQLIIGKMYSPADLAYYNKGATLPDMVITNINSSINSVLLPALSERQDQKKQLKNMTRRALTVSTFIIMPMMMGLAVCAKPLVTILLTEKWLPCVPFLYIFCFTYAFYPVHTTNLNAIKALGRSDLFLKLEIMKKAMGLVAVLVTMWFSPFVMALSLLVTSILSQIINSWPNRKLLNYSYLEQLKDMVPGIALSCIMGAVVFPIQYLPWSNWAILPVQVVLGATIYIGGATLMKIDTLFYILNIAKSFIPKKKKAQ